MRNTISPLAGDPCTYNDERREAGQTRGLEPEGVTVTFGPRRACRVHTFVYSDPILNESFISPRVRARAALKPLSFQLGSEGSSERSL